MGMGGMGGGPMGMMGGGMGSGMMGMGGGYGMGGGGGFGPQGFSGYRPTGVSPYRPGPGGRQMPKAAASKPAQPKTPEPINLELRPGFITDIILADAREASRGVESDEPQEPKVIVEKTLDPLKEEDPLGSRYWKGMLPQPAEPKKGKNSCSVYGSSHFRT